MKNSNWNFLPTLSGLFLIGCSGSFHASPPSPESKVELASTAPDMSKTVELPIALMTPNEVLLTMGSTTGMSATPAALTDFSNRKGTLPVEGQLYKLNSPTINTLTNLSSHFCQNLVTAEVAKTAEQRIYFDTFSFTTGPEKIDSAQIKTVVRSFSRSFWSRNETADELTSIQSFFTDSMTDLTPAQLKDAGHTKYMSTLLCTAMLSSIDTYSF